MVERQRPMYHFEHERVDKRDNAEEFLMEANFGNYAKATRVMRHE